MSASTAVAGLLQLVGGILLAPLLPGTVQTLKARLQGRRGPSPVQPYRELARLWRKSTVTPEGTTILYALAPALSVAALAAAILVVPIAGRSGDWRLGNDALLLVGLLALARFAIALSAWDTGNGFALMGASRDLAFAVFVEALLLLVLVLAALPVSNTDLVTMDGAAAGWAVWERPLHWCAAGAFVFVAIAETGRQPVDNPDTHLELTMIHEGPLLEYAGRDLAFLHWGAAARHWIVGMLAAGLFLPHPSSFWWQLLILPAAVLGVCAALAVTETWLAKMRILRVPRFLAAGGALCVVGLVTWFVGVGP